MTTGAPSPLGLSTILTLALSTGFATAIFNMLGGWWRESQRDRASTERDARYLAIRLAVMLEEYAIRCADQIADNDMFRGAEGYAGKRWGSLPDLPPYPDEDDWRALGPDLLSRVLTFRNERTLGDNKIEFWSDIDPECIPQECDQQCGRSGYAAWMLARDMRTRYGLDAFDRDDRSWVAQALKKQNDKALKMEREQQHLARQGD
jgi:hypothetical protein